MEIKIGETVKNINMQLSHKINTSFIDPAHWYMELFGHYPTYKCDFNINRPEDDDTDIEYVVFKDLMETNEFECLICDMDRDDSDKLRPIKMESFFLISKNEPFVIYYTYGGINVVSHIGIDYVQEKIEKYLKKFDDENKEITCYIIGNDNSRGLYLNNFNIKLKTELDFDLYNDGFEDLHNDIVKSINNDNNGLYLLYGAPGTGKTTYIRNIIKECGTDKRKFIYVPSNLFGEFTSPSVFSFLMENKGCVFIMEDCESLVTTTDGVRSYNISNLLNMADGLLADALDVKIICTFNIDDGEIDEALLRPGRCRCRYEFNLLDKEKANKVAKKLGLQEVDEDVSLAKLFNNGKEYTEKKETKKIGFE